MENGVVYGLLLLICNYKPFEHHSDSGALEMSLVMLVIIYSKTAAQVAVHPACWTTYWMTPSRRTSQIRSRI